MLAKIACSSPPSPPRCPPRPAPEGEVVRIKRNPCRADPRRRAGERGADVDLRFRPAPSPLDPATPMSAVGQPLEDMGDTRAQTISVLGKIRDILAPRASAWATWSS